VSIDINLYSPVTRLAAVVQVLFEVNPVSGRELWPTGKPTVRIGNFRLHDPSTRAKGTGGDNGMTELSAYLMMQWRLYWGTKWATPMLVAFWMSIPFIILVIPLCGDLHRAFKIGEISLRISRICSCRAAAGGGYARANPLIHALWTTVDVIHACLYSRLAWDLFWFFSFCVDQYKEIGKHIDRPDDPDTTYFDLQPGLDSWVGIECWLALCTYFTVVKLFK
jgi:hypothetical protein